ncbi:MAG: thiamine diphosphokinase [Oscillospiraceae bacterium]|nr:thiamine diphosphokinase [Oscillospiraceae bacterium]
MKVCVILAGGDVSEKIWLHKEEILICADCGYRHALAQNLKPDILIGDFDSYTDQLPDNIEIVRYPAEKDVSDTWACVEYAKEKGFDCFRIYGAFGGDRIDHSIANFQMLRNIAEENLNAVLYYKKQILTNLNAGDMEYLIPDLFSYFSVFVLSEVCRGVTITGAKYPLENAELKNNFPLGLSNEVTHPAGANVYVNEGNLLLVMTEK